MSKPLNFPAIEEVRTEFEALRIDRDSLAAENASLRERCHQLQSQLHVGESEVRRLHEELSRERIRTNRWIVMSTKLTANMSMIEGLVRELKTTAIEVAQNLSERNLEADISEGEMEALRKLAGTGPGADRLPPNDL